MATAAIKFGSRIPSRVFAWHVFAGDANEKLPLDFHWTLILAPRPFRSLLDGASLDIVLLSLLYFFCLLAFLIFYSEYGTTHPHGLYSPSNSPATKTKLTIDQAQSWIVRLDALSFHLISGTGQKN